MPDEKPNVKNSPLQKLQKKFLRTLEEWGAEAMQRLFGLTKNWQKHRDIVQNNYALGVKCLGEGDISDAIFRFKIVLWIEPKRSDAWYYLGCAYLANRQDTLAGKALQKSLQLEPDNAEAVYMLAVARGKSTPPEQLPKTMPLSLLASHFEALAAGFAQDQLENYGYQGHVLLCNAIRANLTPGRIDHIILELGAGTGLCGPLLRDIAAKITGVDISGAMLAEAMQVQDDEGNKIYDALIQREIYEYLAGEKAQSADIIMAAGVFSYIGDLQDIFRESARVLKPGGMFAFTADMLDGQGFQLDPEAGRFLFSRPYLQSLATANGLREILFAPAALYPEHNGWLCVFSC